MNNVSPNFIIVKKLISENFRGAGRKEFEFGHSNNIVGDNREGKTSIMEKIAFALCGTTIWGSNRCDHYINNKNGAEKMFVELEIEHPKGIFKIKRTKTLKSTTLHVNGEKTSQPDLERVLNLDVDYFLCVFNPLYLLSLANDSATKEKAKKMIFGLFTPPTKEEIRNQLLPAEANLLAENDIYDAAEVRKENEKLANKRLKLEGQLEELRKTASEEAPVSSPEKQTEIENKMQKLQEKKAQIVVRSQVPKPTEPVLADVNSVHKQIASLRETYTMLKGQIKPLPPKPEKGQKCPSCDQPLPAKKMNQLVAAWQKEVETIKSQNHAIQEKMKEITASGNKLNTEIQKLEQANHSAMETYKKALAEWNAAVSAANSDKEIKKLDEEIEKCLKQFKETAAASEKASSIAKAKEDIVVVEADIAKIDNDIAYNEELIRTIIRYQEAKEKMETDKFSKLLNRVSVKLYDLVKTTGELKQNCRITYNGNPWSQMCTSDRIRAGLEIGALVRRLNNVNYPVFIDDSDLITTYDPEVSLEDVQTFFAIVMAGKKLTVQSSPKEDLAKQDTPAA